MYQQHRFFYMPADSPSTGAGKTDNGKDHAAEREAVKRKASHPGSEENAAGMGGNARDRGEAQQRSAPEDQQAADAGNE